MMYHFHYPRPSNPNFYPYINSYPEPRQTRPQNAPVSSKISALTDEAYDLGECSAGRIDDSTAVDARTGAPLMTPSAELRARSLGCGGRLLLRVRVSELLGARKAQEQMVFLAQRAK